jgi:DNA invertase Pin-like site-specific DNA recombinase
MKGCDRVFSDKPVKHGTTFSRPEFKKMYNFLRKGDTLVITRLDRLAGSLEDLLSALWDFCCGLEVELVVLDEGIDTLSQDCGPMFRALDAIGSALEVWCEEELALERES